MASVYKLQEASFGRGQRQLFPFVPAGFGPFLKTGLEPAPERREIFLVKSQSKRQKWRVGVRVKPAPDPEAKKEPKPQELPAHYLLPPLPVSFLKRVQHPKIKQALYDMGLAFNENADVEPNFMHELFLTRAKQRMHEDVEQAFKLVCAELGIKHPEAVDLRFSTDDWLNCQVTDRTLIFHNLKGPQDLTLELVDECTKYWAALDVAISNLEYNPDKNECYVNFVAQSVNFFPRNEHAVTEKNFKNHLKAAKKFLANASLHLNWGSLIEAQEALGKEIQWERPAKKRRRPTTDTRATPTEEGEEEEEEHEED